MALVQCSECGRDVSDKAAACPNCGNPIVDAQTLVVVEGYPKAHMGFAHVDVFWNGEAVGQVAKGEVEPFVFPGGGTIEVRTKVSTPLGKKDKSASCPVGDGAARYVQMANGYQYGIFAPKFLTEPPSGPLTFVGISFPIP